MNQKTTNNQKQNLRPIPEEEMRQNVLKSGLCNELIAGVLTDDGEIPNLQSSGGNAVANTDGMVQAEIPAVEGGMPHPTDEEMELYIQNCKANCKDGEITIESLMCKIHDLIMQKNHLVDLLSKIKTGEAALISEKEQGGVPMQQQMQGGMQPQMQNGMQPQMQGGMQPQMQMQGGMQPQMQNGMQPQMQNYGGYKFKGGSGGEGLGVAVPRSTGSTSQPAQKQNFIPKSQVEKMSREEIKKMFDVIDRSRKEW